jgi:5S rRNA maturation endonuclease (ribonuclease M5)/archaellum biogenesis ATPase FlaH
MAQREYRQVRSGEVLSFLSRHADWFKAYGDEIRFRKSPCCQHDNHANPSVQINQKSGLWRCFHCGKVGNFFQLAKLYGELISDRFIDPHYQEVDFDIVRKFVNEKRRPIHEGHYPNLLKYCQDRGIGIDTLRDWRVSSKGDQCIRWPIYAVVEGKWTIVNIKVRCIDPNTKTRDFFDVSGGATDLLIGNHLIDPMGPKRAIIFEGQWDAMTAYNMGMKNVFSLPSGASNVNVAAMLRYIPDNWEIWLCTDMDEAGDRCAEKFYATLSTDRLKRLRLPYKDLNEWYQKDPFIDEKDLLQTSVETNHFFLVDKSANEFLKIDMHEEIEIKNRICATSPWETINEKIFGGFYECQTTSVLGQSGHGKTTWVNQIACFVASEGKPSGLISVEGDRTSLKIKLQNTIKSMITPEKYRNVESNLLVSNVHGMGITEQALFSEIEKMVKHGVKLIVIDNLDFIFRNNHEAKSNCYLKLNQIAIHYSIHFVVVWQPNKVTRNRQITSADQKGYSLNLQDSDNYFTINRTINGICILIEKTRERGIGITEDKVWFRFDNDKRIYVEEIRFTKTQYEGKLINLF